MKASTGEANNNRCPVCGDELTEDPSGKGFVRHKTNSDCLHERGQRDEVAAGGTPQSAPSTPSDKGREMLVGRLRKAYIKPGELRGRFSGIIERWNSDTEKDTVTEDELRKLLNEVDPPRDDTTS